MRRLSFGSKGSNAFGGSITSWSSASLPGNLKLYKAHNSAVQNSAGRQLRRPPSRDFKLKQGGQPIRLFDVAVPFGEDNGKDDFQPNKVVQRIVSKRLGLKNGKLIPLESIHVVRKSFDARNKSRKSFVYVVDVDVQAAKAKINEKRQGKFDVEKPNEEPKAFQSSWHTPGVAATRLPVVVVGAGPAGLFAALSIAEAGIPVVLVERGQPVEVRGRDIGAFMGGRRYLNTESNLCFGEGGAGTWSDGKLTTRIGRNEDPVRYVLSTLHQLGAPEAILLSGKPHLGTDRLVHILRNFREHLKSLGVKILFGTKMTEIITSKGKVTGIQLEDGSQITACKVVLAVGHSAREVYRELASLDVAMTPKQFAMGFRIEHPQKIIDEIQYGPQDAKLVDRGRGKIPVADYRLAEKVECLNPDTDDTIIRQRGVYSFCMCPGGQIVPTCTVPSELCINGMSFSKRDSKWANSALVASIDSDDWSHLLPLYGPLAAMELQREIEIEASKRGGGNFVVPVQRLPDFLEGKTSSGSVFSSSYRLGVKSAALHNLYNPSITEAIRKSVMEFDRRMPGFLCQQAILHAAETRTSSPVRIERDMYTENPSIRDLHPTGEGAGYAGGIVSAAVDGLKVGRTVVGSLLGEFRTLSDDYVVRDAY